MGGSFYDSLIYSDPQLSPEPCEAYDHCHHSAGDGVLCGIGFLDYGQGYYGWMTAVHTVPTLYIQRVHCIHSVRTVYTVGTVYLQC